MRRSRSNSLGEAGQGETLAYTGAMSDSERDEGDVRVSSFELAGETIAVLSIPTEPPPRLLAPLSAAEGEVVRLALEGLSNAEIATRRQRAERTIANQLISAFRKLGVVSRQELFALAAGIDPSE